MSVQLSIRDGHAFSIEDLRSVLSECKAIKEYDRLDAALADIAKIVVENRIGTPLMHQAALISIEQVLEKLREARGAKQ